MCSRGRTAGNVRWVGNTTNRAQKGNRLLDGGYEYAQGDREQGRITSGLGH